MKKYQIKGLVSMIIAMFLAFSFFQDVSIKQAVK